MARQASDLAVLSEARCPYLILGVSRTASWEEVRGAYREQARLSHPDKGGDKERFQQVAEAFNILQKRMEEGDFLRPRGGFGSSTVCRDAGASQVRHPSKEHSVQGFPGSPWVPGSPAAGSVPHAGAPGTWRSSQAPTSAASSFESRGSRSAASSSLPAGAAARGRRIVGGLADFVKEEVKAQADQGDGVDPERHKAFVTAAIRRTGGSRHASIAQELRKAELQAHGSW
eukprot:gnl/TRDRNA2_/TRDRNA2_160660_c0_seq1.p1 gnl/TRDRNA2_/TRDRNA2_160660_c0~~gnl/TRDRNA2_/TRDRNA2_160660_c0_seq1.p1  ORF type:complete len:229 (+),score=29.37 gnl/TRDRNA2_/TRDRNA2_160660_c0_seq1:101-787(+)